MNSNDIMTAFTARDEVSPAFDAMGRASDRFSSKASSAFRNATKSGYKFGTIVKGILAANAIHGGINMIGNSVKKVGTDFLEFDDVMVDAATKFDDIGASSKNFGKQLDDVKSKWRSFALGSRFSAAEVAKSAKSMAEAGWDSKLAAGVTPYLLKAAQANSEKDLSSFSDAMTGVWQGFNLKTGDAQKDAASFIKILDQITKGAVDAIGGVTDLKESLKVLAPVWQESESTAATIAFASTLQNAGFPQDMVATAGKNAKMRLASPAIVKGLAADGIRVDDPTTGKIKPIVQLFEEIQAKMKQAGVKPGSSRDISIHEALFGKYAMAGNKSILQHLAAYREEIGRVENQSKGIAGNISDKKAEFSTMNKLIILAGVATDKVFQVFESFNKGGQQGIEGLTQKIKEIDLKPFIADLKTIASATSTLWNILSPFVPMLPYLVAGWLAWNVAIKAVAIGRAIYLFGFLANTLILGLGPMGAMTTAIGALATAMTALAAPILAIAAVGGIGAALYSGITGKDNFISRFAQDLGLVPKLSTDENGVVNGYAPNAKEAAARQVQFNGRLDIAGAPQGSTVSSTTSGAPAMQMHLLGANP